MSENESGGLLDALVGAVGFVKDMVGAVYDWAQQGGPVQGALRQGVDEIGMALKAFPDSIQAYEMGTVFSPTPYDVSVSRNENVPSGAEIAADNTPHSPEQDMGRDQGHEIEHDR
jgi:hypothetical protein